MNKRLASAHRNLSVFAAILAVCLVSPSVFAYETFGYESNGETLYLKWGGDNQAGTPGGVVTFMKLPSDSGTK